jgi:hypothetical protein
MPLISVNGESFESGCDMLDVTSVHRPDTNWRKVDARGHEHQWFVGGKPAASYNPSTKHELPTLVWVHDDWGYYEDGERYEIGHYECRECGEHVEPAYTADQWQQHIPGLRWFRINGEPVSKEEFERRVAEIRR